MRPKVAVIYDAYSTRTNTVFDHVNALGEMTSVQVYFIRQEKLTSKAIENMQGVILHYSCRIAFPRSLGKDFVDVLAEFNGPKFIFIQDEYDNTEISRTMIEYISPKIVFTCVPKSHTEIIYPASRFPMVEFIQVLTGFAPDPKEFDRYYVVYEQRPIDIGYRGRSLGFQYGRLGQEKEQIGKNVQQDPLFATLNLDISSKDSDRIYGENWKIFLSNCKAALGTDSGSNLFDFYGDLKILAGSCKSFVEFESKLPVGVYEFDFMGQISPRIFEAAAARVVNILYPGNFSGLLIPWVHYLPLTRDHSNSQEIIDALFDKKMAIQISDNAYEALISKGAFSKSSFANFVEAKISKYIDFSESKGPLHRVLESNVQIRLDIRNQNFRYSNTLISIWHFLPFPEMRRKTIHFLNRFYGVFRSNRNLRK